VSVSSSNRAGFSSAIHVSKSFSGSSFAISEHASDHNLVASLLITPKNSTINTKDGPDQTCATDSETELPPERPAIEPTTHRFHPAAYPRQLFIDLRCALHENDGNALGACVVSDTVLLLKKKFLLATKRSVFQT
jgi:hypothetical protein